MYRRAIPGGPWPPIFLEWVKLSKISITVLAKDISRGPPQCLTRNGAPDYVIVKDRILEIQVFGFWTCRGEMGF